MTQTITIEIVHLTREEAFAKQEAVALEAVRSLPQPCGTKAIVDAIGPMPAMLRPGVYEIRQPRTHLVLNVLCRLLMKRRLKRTVTTHHTRRYLYSEAA